MLFILTPVLIRHLLQLKTTVFLQWCRICSILLNIIVIDGLTDKLVNRREVRQVDRQTVRLGQTCRRTNALAYRLSIKG